MQRYVEIKVGLMAAAAIAVFVGVVFLLKPLGWFQRGFSFTITFRNARGLRTGAEVDVQGVKVGVVEDVKFSSNNKVAVRVRIRSDAPVYQGSVFRISTHPLLGQSYIAIENPPDQPLGERLSEGAIVRGIESVELEELMPRARQLMDHLNHLVEAVDKLVSDVRIQESVRQIAVELAATARNLRMIVSDPRLLEPIHEAARNIERVTENIAMLTGDPKIRESVERTLSNAVQATDALKRVLNDERIREGLPSLIANLERASEQLERITSDTALQTSLKKTIANLEKATQRINDWVADEELRANLRASIENINRASAELAALLSDEELQEGVKATIRDADELLSQGTRSLQEFQRAVAEIRAVIAENREQLQSATKNIADLTQHMAEMGRAINWLITEGGVSANVREAVQNLRDASRDVKAITQSLKEVTTDAEFKSNIKRTVTNVAELTKSARQLAQRSEALLEQGEQLLNDIHKPVRELTAMRLEPTLAVWHLPDANRTVGDFEITVQSNKRRSYALIGVHDFSGNARTTVQLGRRLWDGLGLRAGLYRSELGIGLDWRLGFALLSADVYDARHPNYNAWLRFKLFSGLYLRAGVEDLRHEPRYGIGLEWRR